MEEVKRYSFYAEYDEDEAFLETVEHPDGEWVSYEDYHKLEDYLSKILEYHKEVGIDFQL